MKKFYIIIISIILILSLAACENTGSVSTQPQSTEIAESTEKTDSSENTQLFKKLSALEGVSSVQVIEQTEKVFKEKYIVTFTQPIDWDNPEAGTFEQRVELGYNGDDNVNCYYVGGYCLNDKVKGQEDDFKKDDRKELCKLFDGNFINIEYRFCGDSVPEGLSVDSVDLWEYLTAENAAKDFNAIIEKLGTILPGKKTFSGRSKGGFTTNTMAYFYPDLCDAYVAYVAPLCEGINDSRYEKNVFETIGNLAYSKKKAASLRQKVIDYQVFCIENRDELQDMLWKAAEKSGYKYRDFVTKDILFDICVLDFAAVFWQYGSDFGKIDTVMEMPDKTDKEHKALIKAAYDLLAEVSSPESWSPEYDTFPYVVQSIKQMGNIQMNFSYLREAVIKKTGKDMLVITEDMQDDLWQNVFFTDEQKAAFQYDDSLKNEMVSWSETTDAHVIMIYGNCDVWYSVRIPDTDNPNVHIFVQNGGCHKANIENLSEKDKKTCMKLLNEWLK